MGRANRCAVLLVAGCRKIRPHGIRTSAVLSTALALASGGDGSGIADGEFLKELLAATNGLLAASNRSATIVLMMQMLQQFIKNSLATKLPEPTRSSAEVTACQLPPDIRPYVTTDGYVVRWFIGKLALALRQLETKVSAADLQLLLSASPQVKAALQASES